MEFKVGDRVKTTDRTMGANLTKYHNVVGTVVRIREDWAGLSVVFQPDVNVPGEVPEWALFPDEVEHLRDEDYWKNKYHALKNRVNAFRYETEGV